MAIENLLALQPHVEFSGVIEQRENIALLRLFGQELPELRDAVTVTDAMKSRDVQITDPGPVSPLPLANYGGRTVFVHPSLVIKGGEHQDRTAIYPGFIAPGEIGRPTEASVIVHCVDHDTLTSGGQAFQGGPTTSAPLASRVYHLRPEEVDQMQNHTWGEIARLSRIFDIHTTNYLKVVEKAKEQPLVRSLIDSFAKPQKGQIGYVLAVANRDRKPNLYAEVVWSPELFAGIYSSLIESAVVTAAAEHFDQGKQKKGIPWSFPDFKELGTCLSDGIRAPLQPLGTIPGVYMIDNGVQGIATVYTEKAAQMSLRQGLN